jgi:hypothetical protein
MQTIIAHAPSAVSLSLSATAAGLDFAAALLADLDAIEDGGERAPYSEMDSVWWAGFDAASESYPAPVGPPDGLRPWLARVFEEGAEAACKAIDADRLAFSDAFDAATLAYRLAHPEYDDAMMAELGSALGHDEQKGGE